MLRALLAMTLVSLPFAAGAQSTDRSGHYLFVWNGDQEKKADAFIAVIDADPASARYGRLVTSVDTGRPATNPHHTEYEMPTGGMLFANDHGANRTFVLDLRHPLKPKVAASFESMGGFSMPHSFVRLPNGNVLASFQYPDHGGHSMSGKSAALSRSKTTAGRSAGPAMPIRPSQTKDCCPTVSRSCRPSTGYW